MTNERQKVGQRGEDLAAHHLVQQGYHILERNLRIPGIGEIDILAQEGNTLVVVEVRTRRGAPPFSPDDSVGPRKQAKLTELAQAVAYMRRWEGMLRVDFVAVELRKDGTVRRLDVLKDIVGQ